MILSPDDPAALDWLTEGVLSRRVLAWLLDAMVVAILFSTGWVVCLVFGVLTLGFGFVLFGALPAIPVLYTTFCLCWFGQTFGQAVNGIAVLRDDGLTKPSFTEALVFSLLYLLSIATSGLILLVALFTPGHRALHDSAAGLLVVRAARVGVIPPVSASNRAWSMPPASWPR
jgi:uncharacterized RDD family membrane protein YckC